MTIMKIKILSLATIVTLISGASLLAATSPQTATVQGSSIAQFEMVQFSNSKEADMMHRAYRILAYGDHDYHGHRVAAMKQVKQAADLLGLDLRDRLLKLDHVFVDGASGLGRENRSAKRAEE